jgi:hypothetical protein
VSHKEGANVSLESKEVKTEVATRPASEIRRRLMGRGTFIFEGGL